MISHQGEKAANERNSRSQEVESTHRSYDSIVCHHTNAQSKEPIFCISVLCPYVTSTADKVLAIKYIAVYKLFGREEWGRPAAETQLAIIIFPISPLCHCLPIVISSPTHTGSVNRTLILFQNHADSNISRESGPFLRRCRESQLSQSE